MSAEVKLSPNVPLQLALAEPAGVPEDFRVHYLLTDGRTLTLPRGSAIELNLLDLREGEAFMICRDVTETKGMIQSTYRVWLPAETEKGRAAEEAIAEQSPVEILLPRGRRRKASPQVENQPRLFDRGTGTYGPAPQQVPIPEALTAQVRASGPVPMDQAFREVVRFVTAALKDAGEQWTDQAKEAAVCTCLIAAAKKGWVKMWERPNV